MNISIIQPSRDNLRYLKWSYDSIRKNQGEHTVQICVADDFSSDGTWEWCEQMMIEDPNFSAIRNNGPTRLGHTILYDRLVNEVAVHDMCMIYHADMYLCPGALDAIEYNMYDLETTTENTHKHLKVTPKEKTIVSLTRIEPPLHPDGIEKLLRDFGIEPESFDEIALLNYVIDIDRTIIDNDKPKTTEGIFAPWAFWKKDFQEIGGHDELYAPQSKEDSDIFNRFHLNGIKFVQTWEGFVYHMTCRGSRFNPTITEVGTESDEWLAQNQRSSRNFIRKWGHFVQHDRYMKPIVPHKYNLGFIVFNCNPIALSALEPWCDRIFIGGKNRRGLIESYIKIAQPDTLFDLSKRVLTTDDMNESTETDILVQFDANDLNQETFDLIQNFSAILAGSDIEPGKFDLDVFEFTVNRVKTYENELIINNSDIYNK